MLDKIDGYVFTELELMCLASFVGMEKIYGYRWSDKIFY